MRRQESRDLTRQKLRSSAMRIFAQQGIAAASIDRIAEEAGFSRGAFYSNYADKHMLALELLADSQTSELAFWTSEIGRITDTQKRIDGLAASFDKFHADGDRALLTIELQLAAERNPAFSDRYNAYLAKLRGGIAELLSVLFSHAGLAPPTDLAFIATTMHSLTIGLAMRGRDDENPGARLAFFLRAILAAGSPAAPENGE